LTRDVDLSVILFATGRLSHWGEPAVRIGFAAILAFVVVLISGTAITYADDPVTATILDVDDSAFPEVRAIVTLDRGGQPVADLRQTDVEAEETGARATVSRLESVENQQLGLGVILAIDTSGSMYTDGKLAAAKTAATQFVDQLQPSDQAAVLNCASQVNTIDGLGGDRAATKRALNNLTPFGDTALYSAVGQSIEAARSVPLPRRAIVLLSDGKEDGGHSTINRSQALAAAADARVPFYIIGLGADIDREFLSELARQSGGTLLEAPSSSDVSALYGQVAQLLKSQYVITLRSTADANTADRRLNLRFNSTAGTAQARLDYTTKRTIAAATAVPAPVIVDEAPVAAAETSSTSYAGVIAALGGIIVLLLLAGGGLYGYRRMQYSRVSREITERSSMAAGDLETSRAATAVPAAATAGVMIAVQGPDATRSARIGREPATIGSVESNQLQLPDSTGRVAPVHARIWSRDGKLVFHQLSASTPTLMAGKAVDWVTLAPGDEVEIGPYRLRVQPS
jgi:VWFA-related protein